MNDIPVKEVKKWIKALRSGEYAQTKGALQDNEGFCCLGVACKALIPPTKQRKQENGLLFGGVIDYLDQPAAPSWLAKIDSDFSATTGYSLVTLNDSGVWIDGASHRFSFDEIADLLEAVYVFKVLDDEAAV